MSQRSQLTIYILLVIVVIASILLVWAFDTGRIFSSADVVEPAITSADKLQSLPAPDKSTFGELFGKVASWFGK